MEDKDFSTDSQGGYKEIPKPLRTDGIRDYNASSTMRRSETF
jgi:hypothetical protein